MNKRASFATVLISLILCGLAVGVAAAQGRAMSEAIKYSGDSFPIVMRTPKGAVVYAASRPNQAELNAIDRGLTDLFAVARKNGYNRKTAYSDYTVFIGRPDRLKNADGQYSPDIAIGAAQYAGTVYDKGGYIYVAGMVISNDPCAFLIAEHTRDLDRMSNVVRYEGEHLILYHNDRRRYLATADHSKGGSHPILQ